MKATQWLQKLAQGFSPGYQRHQQIALKERQTGVRRTLDRSTLTEKTGNK
jgi:hypothetical protein